MNPQQLRILAELLASKIWTTRNKLKERTGRKKNYAEDIAELEKLKFVETDKSKKEFRHRLTDFGREAIRSLGSATHL